MAWVDSAPEDFAWVKAPVIRSIPAQRRWDPAFLQAYAPAAVVVDQNLHVQQFRGRTDLFLEHAPGPASFNLMQLVRPVLVADLRATVQRAVKTDKAARKERAKVQLNGTSYEINIQVVPFKIPASDKSWFLVIFDETSRRPKPEKTPATLGKTAAEQEVTELRRELATLPASVPMGPRARLRSRWREAGPSGVGWSWNRGHRRPPAGPRRRASSACSKSRA